MYLGSHITPTVHDPYHHKCSNSLNIPLLTRSFHRFMRLSSSPYASIHPIQLKTRLIRPDHASNHHWSNGSVGGSRQGVKLWPCHNGTRSGLRHQKAHINDGPLNSLHADTCLWRSIHIRNNLRQCCTSISFMDARHSPTVSFLQDLFRTAVTDLMSYRYLIFTVLEKWSWAKIQIALLTQR